MPDNQIREACEILTIPQVAAALGVEMVEQGNSGKFKSPFRTVKSGFPFSVIANGHAFKDHGNEEHRGNSWKFVELAMESGVASNMSKGEVAKFLISLAGLESDSEFNKEAFKRRKAETRKSLYKKRNAKFLELKDFEKPVEWSDAVSNHWKDGAAMVPIGRLAKSRGWPESWVEWLIELDKVSFPWMPWGDASMPKARHGLAFKVEAPVRGRDLMKLDLMPTGFHQQWLKLDDGVWKKDWIFLPHVPGKASTDFQRALQLEARKTSPFPFVLGDLDDPKNIIITEGQWDAISLCGAAGWLNDSEPDHRTAVFGLRGASSVEVFLSFYGKWIRNTQPNIMLLHDNDKEGFKWVTPDAGNSIIPSPCFAERLRAWGAKSLVHRCIDAKYGKDFNDYWKAKEPNYAQMYDWFMACGMEF